MSLDEFIRKIEEIFDIKVTVEKPIKNPYEFLNSEFTYSLYLNFQDLSFKIPIILNGNYIIYEGYKKTFSKKLIIDFDYVFNELKNRGLTEDFINKKKYEIKNFILRNKKDKDLDEYISVLNSIKKEIDLRNIDYYKVECLDYYKFLIDYLTEKYDKFKLESKGGPYEFLKKLSKNFAIDIIEKQDILEVIDITNPLSNIEDQRKVVFKGNENTPAVKRDIHISHKFKLCPVETPESSKIGLILHLAKNAKIKNNKLVVDSKENKSDGVFGLASLQIPYISYNDPSRALMASKNLKQALPLVCQEEPIIQTGYEEYITKLDEETFYIKSKTSGIVKEVASSYIKIKNNSKESLIELPVYSFSYTNAVVKYNPTVQTGASIKAGDIIAELSGIKDGKMVLGTNLLVFYMCYFGYNVDDAVVISESCAKKLSSYHIKTFNFEFDDHTKLKIQIEKGEKIKEYNKKLFTIDNKTIYCTENMIGGEVIGFNVDLEAGRLSLKLLFERPAEVGDKLMGRYGNKGVISLILKDEEMPYFEKDGKVYIADIILNPHGIISRMNLGQLLETSWSWVAKHHKDDKVREEAKKSGHPFKKTDFNALSKFLKDTGLDERGQIKVKVPLNTIGIKENIETQNPITIGYQYILKLNHLAEKKVHCRGAGKGLPYSLITGMPLKGKANRGGQRFGEMESWAFLAQDNVSNLIKIFSSLGTKEKNVNFPLKALYSYLIGAGFILEFLDEKRNLIDDINCLMLKKPYYFRIRPLSKEYLINPSCLNAIEAVQSKDIYDENGSFEKDLDIFKYIKLEDNTEYLPVIPLRYRANIKSDFNNFYMRILRYRKFDKKKLESLFSKKINGKNGLIRLAFLGKRLDRSGRAVIVPNPKLDINVIELPTQFKKILGLNINDIIFLNRQPTLHMHNLQAFKVNFTDDKVIKINPLICSGFGADFDGDTMAIYDWRKIDSSEGEDLNYTKFSVENHIFLASNGSLNFSLSQDIVSGLFYKFNFDKENFFKNLENDDLFKDFLTVFKGLKYCDAKELNNTLRDNFLERKFSKGEMLKILQRLALLGFRYATEGGISFSIFEILHIREKIDEYTNVEECLKSLLKNKYLNPPIMVVSKSRGNVTQLSQMMKERGEVQRISNEPKWKIEKPYVEGLDPEEYFYCCYGARSGLGDKKLKTPVCGYLNRKLVFMAFNIKIIEEDCGTKEGITVDLSKEDSIKLDDFYGRYLINCGYQEDSLKDSFIDIDLLKNLKSKEVNQITIRSPITCNSKDKVKGTIGICAKCYGFLLNKNELPSIDTNVGIISAQSIGERATQDAMKTFHTGSQATAIKNLDDIIKIFTNPQEIKTFKDIDKDNLAEKRWEFSKLLFKAYENKVSLIHYEVISLCVLSDKPENIGTRGIEQKDFFTRISFSAPFHKIKKICNKGEIELQDSIYKRLIIWV